MNGRRGVTTRLGVTEAGFRKRKERSCCRGDETDVDCGGSLCVSYPDFASCNINKDCQSLNCVSNICEPASSPCGNGICDPFSEDEFICDLDCLCGDGLCSSELEDSGVFPEDCSVVPCGNGVCDPLLGEDGFSGLQDCFCGDGLCNLNDEDGSSCFSDCFVARGSAISTT